MTNARIGVIAAVPADVTIGVGYLRRKGIEAEGMYFTDNPQEQTHLQQNNIPELVRRVVGIVGEMEDSGFDAYQIYCNSLSGTLLKPKKNGDGCYMDDVIQSTKKKFVTPQDVYKEDPLRHARKQVALIAANNNSLSGIENTILGTFEEEYKKYFEKEFKEKFGDNWQEALHKSMADESPVVVGYANLSIVYEIEKAYVDEVKRAKREGWVRRFGGDGDPAKADDSEENGQSLSVLTPHQIIDKFDLSGYAFRMRKFADIDEMLLGCTHFQYFHEDLVEDAKRIGLTVKILDPSERMMEMLVEAGGW